MIATLRKTAGFRLARTAITRTILREGSVATILLGPSRGLKYHIFTEFGLAPLYGGWEPELQREMVKLLPKGGVAYDLGANRGIHAILMARLVGPRGHVYGFEPVPAIRQEFLRNVRLNGLRNVHAQAEAVSDATGSATFFAGSSTATGHLIEQAGIQSSIRVETITLDDFVYQRNAPVPDFLKIDVEGAEGRVLAGAERLLTERRPILSIELHTPEQGQLVGAILSKQGYRAYRIQPRQVIHDLTKGWPAPEGIWGQIIARHPASPLRTSGIKGTA